MAPEEKVCHRATWPTAAKTTSRARSRTTLDGRLIQKLKTKGESTADCEKAVQTSTKARRRKTREPSRANAAVSLHSRLRTVLPEMIEIERNRHCSRTKYQCPQTECNNTALPASKSFSPKETERHSIEIKVEQRKTSHKWFQQLSS